MTALNGQLPRVPGRITVDIKGPRRHRHFQFFNTLTQRAYALLYGTDTIGFDISTTRLSNVFRFLTLGSGSAEVTYTSTALSNPRVPRVTNTQMAVLDRELEGVPCRVFQLSHQFEEGAYTGVLSEIGALDNLDPYTLTAGSRLLDETGAPTSVDVLEDDVLTVYYELYFPIAEFEQPVTFETFTETFNGQAIDVTMTRSKLLTWATAETTCMIKPWWETRPEDVEDGYRAPKVNTVEVPIGQCQVSVDAAQNLAEGTVEFMTNVVVFAPFTAPTISSLELFACPQYAGARGTCPRAVEVVFSPAVQRPANEQIIANMTLSLTWPTS